MQDAMTFWDAAAEKYARSPIQDMDAYEYTLGRIRSYLKQDDQVLEIGCGTGSTALLLSANAGRITASDISSAMIAIGKQKAAEQEISNVDFIAANMFDQDNLGGTYDAVLALNLIHLIEDTSAAFQRAYDLLKPGGFFISKTVCKPGRGSPLKFRLMLPLLPLMQWFGKAPFVKFMTPQELEDEMMAAGFKIIESGNHPAPSRFIVARKPD
ncbi:MAG: class I SAM-dependent methyltransferase [Rhizobiaceae bacterium]